VLNPRDISNNACIKDKNGKIKNITGMKTVLLEHHPYDDLWDQFFIKRGVRIEFFSQNIFKSVFFKYGGCHGMRWKCKNCDFTKSHWSFCFSFMDSTFFQCNFTEGYMLMPSFHNSVYSECDFSNARLNNLLLTGVFKNCNFTNSKLHNISATDNKINFHDCNMKGCQRSFDKNWSKMKPKEIMSDLNQLFSQEQISLMDIKFPGHSIFSKLF
jgi:uncharacterized protein YjbI with pentapeptide repeats